MDQRRQRQVLRDAQPDRSRERGAAERPQAFDEKRLDVMVGLGRPPVHDRDVEPLGLDVASAREGREPDLHVRMQADELCEPRLQPFRREARARRDDEMPALRLRRDERRRARDDAEGLRDLPGIGLPRLGQDRASGMALEERHAEEVLELVDVVADRGGRDAELLRPETEIAVPGCPLEGEEGLERGKSRPHAALR